MSKRSVLFISVIFLLAPKAMPSEIDQVHLSFWHEWTLRGREYLETLARRYEESHPGVRIETLLVGVNQMPQKLLPAVAAGVPPDVIVFNRPGTAKWASENTFTPLDKLIERDGIRAEDFLEACWNECVFADHVWGIPLNTDDRIFYWNKDLFREVGLDPDVPPHTWKELEEYTEKLTKYDERGRLERVGFYPLSTAGRLWGNNWFFIYAYQRRVRFLSEDGRRAIFNSPEAVRTLEWIIGFGDKYDIESLSAFNASLGAESLNPFVCGKVAMYVDGSWAPETWRRYAPELDFGVAPAPIPEDGTWATWSGGFALVIPRNAKNIEAAWDFIKFSTTFERQVEMAEIDNIPARKDAIEAVKYSKSPEWRVAAEMMSQSYYLPKTPVLNILWDEVDRAMQAAIYGGKPAQQALDDAVAKVQAALDRYYSREELPVIGWFYPGIAGIGVFIGALLWAVLLIRRRLVRKPFARREALAAYLFASPWMIGFVIFIAGPIFVSFVFGFCEYRILSPARWLGFQNYQELLTEDPLFWKSLYNTIYYVVFAVPLGIMTALLLAILLNQPVHGISFYRTFFYLPSVISGVAVCVLWVWILNPEYGLLNTALAKLGITGPGWLTDVHWSKPALVIMSLWGVGGGMIIFLAALQGIPRQFYEAARVDGAGTWKQFVHVTVPMLTPAIFFNLVMGVIMSFQIFTQAYVMTTGGPMDSTRFYALYLFENAFQYFRMGYASAMAWIMFAIILTLTLVQMYLAKRWVYYEVEES